jgi:hypothetical protein
MVCTHNDGSTQHDYVRMPGNTGRANPQVVSWQWFPALRRTSPSSLMRFRAPHTSILELLSKPDVGSSVQNTINHAHTQNPLLTQWHTKRKQDHALPLVLLTEEQHCGVRCQLHADVHSLALSAADATHPLVTDLGVSDLVQTKQLQSLVHQLQLYQRRHQSKKGMEWRIIEGQLPIHNTDLCTLTNTRTHPSIHATYLLVIAPRAWQAGERAEPQVLFYRQVADHDIFLGNEAHQGLERLQWPLDAVDHRVPCTEYVHSTAQTTCALLQVNMETE